MKLLLVVADGVGLWSGVTSGGAFAMSVLDLVGILREKMRAPREGPEIYWTGVMTVLLVIMNLILLGYFILSEGRSLF